MKRNLPLHKIHDPAENFGYLLFPWFKKDRWGKLRWWCWFSPTLRNYWGPYEIKHIQPCGWRMRLSSYNGFHNCTTENKKEIKR